MSKNVKIIVSVLCLVLAAGILYFTTFRSEGGGDSGDVQIWLKCVNPDCNQAYSLTPDEFLEMQHQGGMNPMMMMPGQSQAFKCKKCGQQSAYMAQKCEKCKEVFIMQMPGPGEANQDFPDRCPKCGYSAIEQAEKQQK